MCFVIFWGAQNIAGESSLKIPYGTIAVKDSKITAKDQPLLERETAAAMWQKNIDELLRRPNTTDREKKQEQQKQ